MGNKYGRGIPRSASNLSATQDIIIPDGHQVNPQGKGSHEDVEQAVMLWFRQMRAKNVVVSGTLMLVIATQLARRLDSDFIPTRCWLEQLKTREGITFHSADSEETIVDEPPEEDEEEEQTEEEERTDAEPPDILEHYDPDDQFNFDETALLFRAVPPGMLADDGGDAIEGRAVEERLTLAFMTNASGSDKRVFVIGKSVRPRCFLGVKKVPLPYFANSRAWMSRALFSQLCTSFDAEMRKQNRRVLLFLDDAACHDIDASLTHVKQVILPASSVQPLRQGIIQTFKCCYRMTLMRHFLSTSAATGKDVRETAREVDVLRAVQWIKAAWSLVTPAAISNCFRKAGFVSNSAAEGGIFGSEAATDDNSPALHYIAVDDDLKCCGEESDAEPCGPGRNSPTPKSSSDDDTEVDPMDSEEPAVSKPEALEALNTLRRYLQENCAKYDSFFKIEKKIQKSML